MKKSMTYCGLYNKHVTETPQVNLLDKFRRRQEKKNKKKERKAKAIAKKKEKEDNRPDWEKKWDAKYGKGTTTKTTTIKSKPCHEGTLLVFKDPVSGIKIQAGGRCRDVVVYHGNILIDVGINKDPVVRVCGFNQDLFWEYQRNPMIKIDWADFGTPALEKPFWEELISVIRKEGRDVIIACVGGHGRTGTALSILAGLMGVTQTDPVAYIREHYCKKAVENDEQVKYVERMTGMEVYVKPSKIPVSSVWYWKDGVLINEDFSSPW